MFIKDNWEEKVEHGTYKIGEAASLLNLKTYVLRFWETEFSQIAPLRTEKGQRLYTEQDILILKRIRFLLHDRGLTIEGAKRILQEEIVRGHDFTDSSLLYLVDEHEEFASDSAFPQGDLEEPISDSRITDSHKARQKILYETGTNISSNEPLFQSNDNLAFFAESPLQQDRESNQAIKQRVPEENLQKYVLDELEDIAKILRSHTNLGGHL